VSFSDILSGEFDSRTFTDKIVLVGTTAVGTHDLLSTPFSSCDKPFATSKANWRSASELRRYCDRVKPTTGP
jgi:CHASE2 domain-containing sensor protein